MKKLPFGCRLLRQLPPMSEGELLRQVLELARLRGWLSFHARPGRTAKGWRTPVQGAGAGFPALVLVRGTTLLFVELKADRGRLRRNQEVWLNLLRAAGQRVHVWRPSQWSDIEEVLA